MLDLNKENNNSDYLQSVHDHKREILFFRMLCSRFRKYDSIYQLTAPLLKKYPDYLEPLDQKSVEITSMKVKHTKEFNMSDEEYNLALDKINDENPWMLGFINSMIVLTAPEEEVLPDPTAQEGMFGDITNIFDFSSMQIDEVSDDEDDWVDEYGM